MKENIPNLAKISGPNVQSDIIKSLIPFGHAHNALKFKIPISGRTCAHDQQT